MGVHYKNLGPKYQVHMGKDIIYTILNQQKKELLYVHHFKLAKEEVGALRIQLIIIQSAKEINYC